MSTDCDNATTSSGSPAEAGPVLLDIRELRVHLLDHVTGDYKLLIDGVDLRLCAGSILGIAGQSGGGKSTLSLAVSGLLPSSAYVEAAHWRFFGDDVLKGKHRVQARTVNRTLQQIARKRMFKISQDARSTLLPYRRIQWHLKKADVRRERRQLLENLTSLGLEPAAEHARKLPLQLSTGECQRVQFAMAELLARRYGEGFLLVADEPFASVDSERTAQMADRISQLARPHNALILVTHHLRLLRQVADQVVIVHGGKCVEQGKATQVLDTSQARQTQTRQLLSLDECSRYQDGTRPETGTKTRVLGVTRVSKSFGRARLKYPSFQLSQGQRLGLLGPSGSGKTTLGRILMGIIDYDTGTVDRFENPAWTGSVPSQFRPALWKQLQMVHQDADVAFDPPATMGQSLVDAYQALDRALPNREAWQLAGKLLAKFHLPGDILLAPANRISGGERRRCAIARALAALGWLHPTASTERPLGIVLDEPTVGIDVFLQGVLADALSQAQTTLNLSYLVISHDRQFVNRFCDDRIELHGGKQ